MQTVDEVMSELKKKGTEQTRKTFARHNAPENMFGVKVADLKVIVKKIKGNHELALQLFETGNADAQYLAGLVADGSKMTKTQLNGWAKNASWHMVAEYPVAWVASESPHARDLANKWIKSKNPQIASAGWCTWSGIVATRPDDELDLAEIRQLLDTIVAEIHGVPDRVRYTMNGFVIAVGGYVRPMAKAAKAAAKKIGKVTVNMGDTACKVPDALPYIEKMESAGRAGKKRKTIRC